MSKIFPSLSQLINLFTGGPIMQMKVIEIGDWNLDTTALFNVAHGLTLANIRTVTAIIRNDANTEFYVMGGGGGASDPNAVELWFNHIDATNVKLRRDTGGAFDGAGFASPPSSNRGWITIWYEA